jgi:hypothetical protein
MEQNENSYLGDRLRQFQEWTRDVQEKYRSVQGKRIRQSDGILQSKRRNPEFAMMDSASHTEASAIIKSRHGREIGITI